MTSSGQKSFADDTFLLLQVAQGSKEAFNEIFEKYWAIVYANAYKRLKSSDQANDIVQDIFTHIWTNRANLKINNVGAYLHTAVRNKVIKLTARQKQTHSFYGALENIPEKAMSADSGLLWKEFSKAYENLLRSLPPQRQIIFRLRFQNDLPTGHIADILGLSRKTVQNQLGKAIEKLKVGLLHCLLCGLFLLPL